jgi:putative membrane protein
VVKKRNVGRLLKSGCNEEENEEILKLLFKNIPKRVMLTPIFVNLFFGIPINSTTFGFFYVCKLYSTPTLAICLFTFYVLFVGIVYFSFRNNRLFINDDFIIRQSGAWDVDNEIIEPGKIQAITTSQLFWHKSVDIGSITIHTAGGNISFQLGNFTTIKQYVNLWLYEMETSDSNWM